jgi:hypothetical protein
MPLQPDGIFANEPGPALNWSDRGWSVGGWPA